MTMTLKDTVAEDAALEVAEFIPAAPKAKPVDVAKINTLHELLAVAIGDFEKVLANPFYRINMGEWHKPTRSGAHCTVCLAGSVLAGSMKTAVTTDYQSTPSNPPIDKRMAALNMLRTGDISYAYYDLHGLHGWGGIQSTIDVLNRKWAGCVVGAHATNRRSGYRLLAQLKLMHKDLAEAGI